MVAVVACLAACGKSKDNKAGGTATSGTPSGGTAASGNAATDMPAAPTSADGTAAVAGTVVITGSLTGTFMHRDESVTCGSVPDVGTFGFSVSMSDGNGHFIALDGTSSKDKTELNLSSPALGGTTPQTTGFTITGDGKHVFATIDTTIAGREGKTATVKAKLAFTCP